MDSGAFSVHTYACAWQRNTVAPYLSRSHHESRLQLLVTVARVACEIDLSFSRFSYVSNLTEGFLPPDPIVLYYLASNNFLIISFTILSLNSKALNYLLHVVSLILLLIIVKK